MRRFNNDEEANAWVAAQRSSGVAGMEDQCLLMVLMGGTDDPDFAACEAEAERRAMAGSLHCQRALYGLLLAVWNAGGITDVELVERGEPVSRMAASQGDPVDIRALVDLLSVKALSLRRLGAADAAYEAQVEALTLVSELGNESDDPEVIEQAGAQYRSLVGCFSEDAVEGVRWEMIFRAFDTEQRLEPEVAARIGN